LQERVEALENQMKNILGLVNNTYFVVQRNKEY